MEREVNTIELTSIHLAVTDVNKHYIGLKRKSIIECIFLMKSFRPTEIYFPLRLIHFSMQYIKTAIHYMKSFAAYSSFYLIFFLPSLARLNFFSLGEKFLRYICVLVAFEFDVTAAIVKLNIVSLFGFSSQLTLLYISARRFVVSARLSWLASWQSCVERIRPKADGHL